MAEDFRGLEEEMNRKVQEITDHIFQKSQEQLVADNKIDTGHLLKTGNVNRGFMVASIVYPAPYAEEIEYGRQPGRKPPIPALQKWVRRKLGVEDPDEAHRIAVAIAFNIEKRGLQPFPFIKPAVESAEKTYGV